MSAPPPVLPASLSTSGYQDGLGRRSLAFDRESGSVLERLIVRPELSAFERALRQRADHLATFDDERVARVREIVHDPGTQALTVVSEFVGGQRLADLLEDVAAGALEETAAPSIDQALGLLLQLLPALSALHTTADVTHGVVGPGRIAITPAGEIVLLDAIYGPSLERLQLSRFRLWSELRVAHAPSAGVCRFNVTADIAQAALAAAAVTVGRPLGVNDYPDGLGALLNETVEIAQLRGSARFASAIQRFFERALPLPARRIYGTAEEANAAVQELVEAEMGATRCRTALAALVRDAAADLPVVPELHAQELHVPELHAPELRPTFDSAPTELQPTFDSAPTDLRPSFDSAPTDLRPSFDSASTDLRLTSGVPEPEQSSAVETLPEPEAQYPDVRESTPEVSRSSVEARSELGLSSVEALGEVVEAPAVQEAIVEEPVVAEPLEIAEVPAVAVPQEIAAAPAAPAVVESPSIVEPPEVTAAPVAATPAPPKHQPPSPKRKRSGRGRRDRLRSTDTRPTPPPAPAPIAIEAPVLPPPPIPVRMPSYEPLQQPNWSIAQPVPLAPIAAPAAIVAPPVTTVRLKPEPARTVAPPPRPRASHFDDVSAHDAVVARPHSSDGSSLKWKIAAAAAIIIAVGVTAGRANLLGRLPEPVTKAVAPATEPPPVAAEAPSGSIAIETQPDGARILLDGKPAGESPLKIDGVATGSHIVTLITSSTTLKRAVKVEAGKTTSIDVPVYSGWIAVSSPIVLDVGENGRAVGSTEHGRVMLPAGRHTLTFTNKELGYSIVKKVDIESGEERAISIEPRGTISLNAIPWAEVFIDGTRVGETPMANFEVPLGTRELLFKHPQFGERRVTEIVKATGPSTVSVDFTK